MATSALQYYASKHSMYSFQDPLAQILRMNVAAYSSNSEDAMLIIVLKQLCMSLINSLLDGIDDLEERFMQRIAFWNVGQPISQVPSYHFIPYLY
jgi:hypothetical protein